MRIEQIIKESKLDRGGPAYVKEKLYHNPETAGAERSTKHEALVTGGAV
jgi:hypothetical protein